MESLFTHLLAETRAVHDATPPLREFADWPEDLVFERPVPREIPALPTIEAMAGKGALYAALAAVCLLYTSPSPRDQLTSRMPSSA